METIVISLGGSIIVPSKINQQFLGKFRKAILDYTRKGNRAIIICGGGATARNYIRAADKMSKATDAELDFVGIQATRLNAQLLKTVFGNDACKDLIQDPTQRITTNKKIIIGAGWLPGWSTDYDAVLSAEVYGARRLVNLSNIANVYNKDPKKYKTAKKIDEISWRDFRKIVGSKWVPGKNAPFDPVAARHAEKLKLRVIVAKGTDLKNLENILSQRKFKGTLIK